MHKQTSGIVYASVTALLWGFLAIALKVAVREIEPVTVVWFRFVFAFIMLAVWQLLLKPASFRIFLKPPPLLWLAALGLSWNYMGYMLGIHYTTPGNAQLFIQSGPIMLALAGILFFKEKITRIQLLGFLLTMLGISLFYGDQLSAFFESQEKYNTGVLFTLSGALAWAVYATSQKQLVIKFPVESLNLFLFAFPALIYIPFVNFQPLLKLGFSWWLLLVFLGANTFVAYTCLAKALKYLEASKVSIIIILNPVITFIIMALLTRADVSWIQHERFSLITIFGAALVFSGAAFVVGKKRINRKA